MTTKWYKWHTIKIDLDLRDARKRHAAVRRVGWVLVLCEELLGVLFTAGSLKVYRTRHGVHVSVEVYGSLSPAEIVAIQLACGSDEIRELLNLRRTRDPVFKDTDAWNVLFDERSKDYSGRKTDYRRRVPDDALRRTLLRKCARLRA